MLRKIKFTVQAVPGKEEKVILMRVFLEDGVVSISTGYTILPSFWLASAYRVMKNAVNEKRQTAREINRQLEDYQEWAEKTFDHFEYQGVTPSTAIWRQQFQILRGKVTRINIRVADLFTQFEQEKGLERAWSSINYVRNDTVLSAILKFSPDVKARDFNKEWLSAFHAHLIERGLSNTTIKKHLTFTKAFINWLSEKRMIDDHSYKQYLPKIKEVKNKTVIYLEEDELKRMIDMKIPDTSVYLEKVRDVFVFGCFTGMRFSDIKSLKKRDVYNDAVHFTANKTDKATEVELNDVSRRILDKYRNDGSVYALPVPQNQHINRWIKDVALMAGINQEVVVEHYIGARKITEIKPKWQLMDILVSVHPHVMASTTHFFCHLSQFCNISETILLMTKAVSR